MAKHVYDRHEENIPRLERSVVSISPEVHDGKPTLVIVEHSLDLATMYVTRVVMTPRSAHSLLMNLLAQMAPPPD